MKREITGMKARGKNVQIAETLILTVPHELH